MFQSELACIVDQNIQMKQEGFPHVNARRNLNNHSTLKVLGLLKGLGLDEFAHGLTFNNKRLACKSTLRYVLQYQVNPLIRPRGGNRLVGKFS